MGVVYRAEDLKLKRPVALKFLPEDLSGDGNRLERLRREARAASSLNDPHICTIYDIDEDCGRPFIAMELLEGQTLQDLVSAGPLALPQALDVASQVAAALCAAHARGIVHRDIKPANIFVCGNGHVKVLDFGLAKSTPPPADAETVTALAAQITNPGEKVGTVAYMSPEQARGEDLDPRTDLFSFGVVLYVMATGRLPFTGSSVVNLIDAILHRAPTAPVRLNPACPREFERIINKALEKNRDLRYQTARDLAADLARLKAPPSPVAEAPAVEQASIVVLPFENLSPDPDNAFFADGLTEELIAELARLKSLRVISRTTAMLFQGAKKSVPEIASLLNVRYVLEGSVRRAGTSVRITAQLIDASTDMHVWAERYTGTLEDVFDLQERLARSIVQALRVTLSADEDRQLAARQIEDPRAFDLYLRARRAMHSLTSAGLERALVHIEEALAITGPNALLFGAKGESYFWLRDMGIRPDDATLDLAMQFASEALRLSPDSAAGLQVSGLVAWKRADIRRAVLDLRRSAELSGEGSALGTLAFVAAEAGLQAEARRAGDRAASLDPQNWFARFCQAFALLLCGDVDSALVSMQSALELSGESPVARMHLAIASAYSGREEEALASFREVAATGDPAIAAVGMLFEAALTGDSTALARVLSESPLDHLSASDKEFCWWMADCQCRIGDFDGACLRLEHAIALGFVNHRFWAEVDPFLAPLRNYSRFQSLMEIARHRQTALGLS